MQKEKAFIVIVLSLAFHVIWPKFSSADETVLRVNDRSFIPFSQMIQEVMGTDLLFIGELHDREDHHAAQFEVIRAIKTSGAPMAVGLEMFTARNQQELDEWVEGKMEVDRFIKLYYSYWKLPWHLYSDIFFYLREHRIPMVGLNVPRQITQKVAEEGFGSLGEEELAELPPGLACDVDERYMEYIKKMFEVHGRPEEKFVNFCEAQILWDKVMAWYLKKYTDMNPGRTVVVLTGITHALKKGIPEQATRLSTLSFKVIVPVQNIPLAAITEEYADYVLLY